MFDARAKIVKEILRSGDQVPQGKYISAILLSLGWCRRRHWSTTGQYNRYWLPPK